MIELKGLTKHYGDTVAVSDLTFEVRPKEVLGFLGPNGAGKSTTLKILSGFLAPTAGTAMVAGCDIIDDNLEVRRNIGYLPENNPLYEDMYVTEYLEWSGRIRGFSGRALGGRVRKAIEACDLGEVLGKKIDLLSKGFRQRVGLAAAILHDPKILLLDEPTSGLDPNQAREVRLLISRLKEEKTVLLSTHILPEVEASCDRVVILHGGRIAAEGTPSELVRGASGRQRLRLTLQAGNLDPDRAAGTLRAQEGIDDVRVEMVDDELRAELEVKPDAPDLRAAIFALAVRESWTLLELRRESASLESVFSELTLQ
ncbi:MAG: ATP-binding cassette domain-containing protein [Elusimicrobiota bacterium]